MDVASLARRSRSSDSVDTTENSKKVRWVQQPKPPQRQSYCQKLVLLKQSSTTPCREVLPLAVFGKTFCMRHLIHPP
jgi:hypothetical protein